MKEIIDKLRSKNIAFTLDEELKNHTSFKIGGKCSIWIEAKNTDEIIDVLKISKQFNYPLYVIGNGSNMLICDEGIEGIFLHFSEEYGNISVEDNIIKCESGALLSKVCNKAKDCSLTGMECLFGIPGSIGGGLFMNAGAYGTEMKEVVFSAEYLTYDGEIKTAFTDEMNLSYRHSVFQTDNSIILSVTLKLKKGNKEDISSKMKECLNKRKDKQPLEYPSAGSVFKRPEGYFAGALIEKCGLKGKKIGGAMVSEKHAGFIINYDNASAKDITELIDFCKDTVKRKTGVELIPEIKLMK